MKKFDLAIVSPNNRADVIGTLTVWAQDIKAALKRARNDPDMIGVHIYPINKGSHEQRLVSVDQDNEHIENAVAALDVVA